MTRCIDDIDGRSMIKLLHRFEENYVKFIWILKELACKEYKSSWVI